MLNQLRQGAFEVLVINTVFSNYQVHCCGCQSDVVKPKSSGIMSVECGLLSSQLPTMPMGAQLEAIRFGCYLPRMSACLSMHLLLPRRCLTTATWQRPLLTPSSPSLSQSYAFTRSLACQACQPVLECMLQIGWTLCTGIVVQAVNSAAPLYVTDALSYAITDLQTDTCALLPFLRFQTVSEQHCSLQVCM